MDILFIIFGIALVLRGADNLTDSSVSIARRLRISELVIGLTIVAFGTSMPELCVSVVSALNGTTAMAIGNVVGSNIFNVLLIVGVCAVIHPMSVSLDIIRRDIPFAFIGTLMLIFFLKDGMMSRAEALVLLAGFTGYVAYTLSVARKAMPGKSEPEAVSEPKDSKLKIAWKIVIGLAELVVGSHVFVGHATSLATSLGVSDAVIGITILGAGTSLPELATSAVAALKGRTSMALGNVIGSCIFNVLLILGVSAVIVPLSPDGITTVDLATLFLSILLLWFFSFTKQTMARWEGAVLTVCFIAYMTFLIYNA
ncbi:MAG: calcium/sodium antiporter [Prevotella sp.]